MKEIKLKLSDGAFRAIRENCYASGLAGSDSLPVHAWVKVIEAITDEESEYTLQLKSEVDDK